MKEKRRNLGVSEIIGTILLLGITVSLFSALQLIVFSGEQQPQSPKTLIGGYLKDGVIVLQNQGGPSLDEQTNIQYQIDSTEYDFYLNSSYFIDDNKNDEWDVGEQFKYPVSINEESYVEVKVIDIKTNRLLFINVLQQGKISERNSSSPPSTNNDWWNESWSYRRQLNISTGPNTPYRNYNGYTVQFQLDTSDSLFLPSCDDVRIVYQADDTFVELDREIINPHLFETKIRFRLKHNISANFYDDNYFVYYANPTAENPPADKKNVYLWYDSAETNRENEYIQGRVDRTSHGGNWGNTIEWNPSGYYDFNTGDNYVESLRPANRVERDVLVEYEIYQSDAYPIDMTTGPLLRWIGSGTEDSEDSSHFFYYEMADSAYQSGGYDSHDDVTCDDRNNVQIEYGQLEVFPQHLWVRVGCAAWGVSPSNIKTYYNNQSGGWKGFRFQGTIDDNVNPGQFGIWIQQDQGRIKNILARRYVEPEPEILIREVEQK